MNRRARAATLALVLVAACSDLSIDPAVNQIQVAIADPSFSGDVMPVLRQTCGSSGACHGGANPVLGLNLEDDALAYASLVNVPSTSRPRMRVLPGKADSSFLYLVLRDTASLRLDYYRMPLTQYSLPLPTRETIRNWINKGAKNN